jgi:hypothetical protein
VLDLDALPNVTEVQRTAYARLVAEAKERLTPARRAKVRVHIVAATPSLSEAKVEQEITVRLDRAERGELDTRHVLYFANRTDVTAGELAHARALDGKRLADPQEPTYRQGDDAIFHWRDGDWCIVSWAHGVRKIYRLAIPVPALTPYQRRFAARVAHFKRQLYADPYFGAPQRRAQGIPVAVLRYEETSRE